MADIAPRWPNVERLVVAWLRERITAKVYTETSDSLTGPALVVERAGGSDEPLIGKRIMVEVASVGGGTKPRAQMWELVGKVESAMAELEANGTADWYVDEVEETFSAAPEPTGNAEVRRARATYALSIRPR